MNKSPKIALLFLLFLASLAPALERMPGVWSNWRGPMQSGVSEETGLPSSWSPSGENLAWKAPVGGRSSPIFMYDRLYLVNTAGEGATEQEQLVCMDANTGKVLWTHRFNVYGSDVPPHRVGWASPVGDPATERIYVMGVGGLFFCLDRNGKLLWEHPLAEEFGILTTHGGRTNTPVVFENLVITSGITFGWGNQSRGGHRYMAFDKMTGEAVWVAQPGGQPYDTTYSTALIATLAGKTMLLDGMADGAIGAIKARTGEKIWNFTFSKRGLNTALLSDGKRVYATQGEENIDTNVMGRVVALNPSLTGDITKTGEIWRADGHTISYATPSLHEGKIYALDNGANLFALDASNGKQLWKQNLGTLQRAAPVIADGKIYVGTENGKFYILRPGDSGCEILDSDQLSDVAGEEAIYASVAIARGRVFLVSSKSTYCIGPRRPAPVPASTGQGATRPPSMSPIRFIQVVPAEVLLGTGESALFRARSFDADGNFIREEKPEWTLSGLEGNIGADGRFSSQKGPQAGEIRAAAGGITGTARVRVVPPLPWTEDFQSLAPGSVPGHWVGAGGKFQVREVEGNKVLVKLSNEQSLLRRARAYMGPWNLSNYTVEADILGTERRRQMPDIGIIAQRYALVLTGNAQKLGIESWQPETERTVSIPFAWKPGVWYRMKLRVENASGKAIVRGKVWLKTDPEPSAWAITKEDRLPNLVGGPGFYCYAHNEAYYDNISVTENSK